MLFRLFQVRVLLVQYILRLHFGTGISPVKKWPALNLKFFPSIEFNNTILYILGGYQNVSGFLNSVEKYDKNAETFAMMSTMAMPERKSHFCTLLVEVKSGI